MNDEVLRYQEAQEQRIQALLKQVVKLREQLKKLEEEQFM
jgi:hypothetical protein